MSLAFVGRSFHRKARVSSSLPNEASITRLIGAVLFEQNDEWQTQHRYMQLKAFSQSNAAQTDPILSVHTQAA